MFLKVENICKSFGELQVLKNINMEINSGEQVAILGSSGSGKSTLLYLLGALDLPTQGHILYDHKSLDYSDESLALFRNKYLGFVFQFHFLLPSMSCWDNILLPVKIAGENTRPYEDKIGELSQYLAVDHCLKKYPYEVSGGEQQRLSLIRAVIMSPKLLLCDEPTGNLDSMNSIKVMDLLQDLAEKFKATLVVVTHDQNLSTRFSRKIVIEDGQIIG